jgi:hypothetical protein
VSSSSSDGGNLVVETSGRLSTSASGTVKALGHFGYFGLGFVHVDIFIKMSLGHITQQRRSNSFTLEFWGIYYNILPEMV